MTLCLTFRNFLKGVRQLLHHKIQGFGLHNTNPISLHEEKQKI